MYSRRFAENFKKIVEENIQESLRQKSVRLKKRLRQSPLLRLLIILFYALSLRASDVHMEIFEDGILMRFRIDGVLHEITKIPKEVHPAIVN